MLKRYRVGEFVCQYEEDEQPKGAAEVPDMPVPASKPKTGAKAGRTANKARAAANK